MTKVFEKITLAWFAAIAICIAIVKLTAIGPVILTISSKYGMGVHTFDLVTIIPVALATAFTVAKIRASKKLAPVKVISNDSMK